MAIAKLKTPPSPLKINLKLVFFQQMKTLFGTQYEDIHLEILKTRLDEAVYNAAGLVYLEIAANVSETYKKSTNLTNS